MVESVAWIAEQKNTLSTVFYLSAMYVYLEFDESRRPAQYFTAMGLFTLALLSKTITVTLPAALLVIFWWQLGALSWKRDVRPLVPFFALSFAVGLMTYVVERTYFTSHEPEITLTFAQRFLVAGRAIWFYVGKLAWPANLVFTYPRWKIEPSQSWQWIFPLAALALTFILGAVRQRWRAPLAGWLFFCGTLLPVLGFLNVFYFNYSYVADHFQYLPCLGLIVLASAAIALGLARLPQAARPAGVALCMVLVGTLAVLSWAQCSTYSDAITLYQETLKRNPDSWLAHNNLGLKLEEQGKRDEAIAHFEAAFRIEPGYLDALNNLGLAYSRMGRFPESIKYLEHGLLVDPNYASLHNSLGLALSKSGQNRQAIEHFRRSLELNPDDANTHSNLGLAFAATNDPEQAVAELQRAFQLAPDSAEIRFNLGDVLFLTGRFPEAIEHYRAAMRLQPAMLRVYASLAQALGRAGQAEEAVAIAQQGVSANRSRGQIAAAEQLEDWLSHYQKELERSRGAESTSPQ
jgi:tetratricopeptide (TPR) repeat protein